MEKNRLEAFSDGVFAIVITIMVFEIKIPNVEIENLRQSLFALLPKLLSFALSFIIIGVYWVSHHNMMNFIEKIDRSALWLNIMVLFFVCTIPLPTALLGNYPFEVIPIVVYGATLCFTNLSGALFWNYCTNKENLRISKMNPNFVKTGSRLHLAPIIFYTSAIGLSFISAWISYAIFLFVPLFFIIPNPILNKLFRKAYLE